MAQRRSRDESLAADRLRKRKERAAERDIVIDFSRQDKRRINAGRNNAEYFLRKYFPDRFFLEFSEGQSEHIREIRRRMEHGDLKAIADFRSSGKTTITKGMIVWGLLYGIIKWCIWIESNFDQGKDTVEDIKSMFNDPEGDDLLRDDFPQYVDPIRALNNEPQKARSQTYKGQSTGIKWEVDRIILPTVRLIDTPKQTPAFGGIIGMYGVEKQVRGLSFKGRRPDFVAINDVETEETAKSPKQTEQILRSLTNSVLGLGAATRGLGAIMLCTILRRGCVADQLTDRKKYPQWQGERRKMLVEHPVNIELWDQYMYLRRKDWGAGLEFPINANKYYKKHRRDMDEGAVVSNEQLYISAPGPDGKPKETSAIQHIYNIISDLGETYFLCECQNDPPEELDTRDLINEDQISEKTDGYERGVVPEWVEKITTFVDVHDRKLYWTAIGWRSGFVGHVIDYDVHLVRSPERAYMTKKERSVQVDLAILTALDELKEKFDTGFPVVETGEMKRPVLNMIDRGYRPDVVAEFIRSTVGGYAPALGIGGRLGKYRSPRKLKGVKEIGSGYHAEYNPVQRVWEIRHDPDKWKKRAQSGFLVRGEGQNGSISLFGDDAARHKAYSEHIVAEAYDSDKGKYVLISRQNHWLDTTAGCCLGAEYVGIRLLPKSKNRAPPRKAKKVVRSNRGIRTRY